MNKKGNEPGIKKKNRDKNKTNHAKARSRILLGLGPVGIIIAKIIDTIFTVIRKIVEFFWYSITLPTFNFVWNLMFSEFHGIFAGKDKDGDCYNSNFFRYIITILLPPLGVFMSKGLSGWPSIGISIILTLFHIFPGIIYAFIVTHQNRYADRYQQRELDRIEAAKKRRMVDPDANKFTMTSLLISVAVLLGILYVLIKIARMIASIVISK